MREKMTHRRDLTPALTLSALWLAVLSGCAPTSFLVTPVSGPFRLEERVLQRESPWARKKIALLDVDGVLQNARESSLLGFVGENPVALFKEKLDKAAADKNVKAVVLRINSPGGSVTASDLMYTELRRFRQQTGKPVIACMLDLATSGGYYLACAADRVYAHPTTVTGSIGVIMIAPDVSGTMKLVGIRANVFKSGAMKDAGSPFREMTEQDRAVFQTMVEQMYARFLEVVSAARPNLGAERLRELADGRVYLAPTAKEHGLIDEIGTLPDAVQAAKQAAGLTGERTLLVSYARPLGHRPNAYANSAPPPPQVNVVNLPLPSWLSSPSPQFLYLWAPAW
ncbi:MAG: signal peptide peptidase SppA [Planctomycetes bacterium]|nr:signal peptide peptidase SppA [Planctomycetota bacterium]